MLTTARNVALLLLTCALGACPCPDPNLRHPVIGGHVIQATVLRAKKPMRGVRVRLFSSDKLIWTGKTGGDGAFTISDVPSAKYKLQIAKWGSISIELKPTLDMTGLGQRPSYSLMLLDDVCAAVVDTVN